MDVRDTSSPPESLTVPAPDGNMNSSPFLGTSVQIVQLFNVCDQDIQNFSRSRTWLPSHLALFVVLPGLGRPLLLEVRCGVPFPCSNRRRE